VKEVGFNGAISTLLESWASRSSCNQRRGRAGRCRTGICYRLFSKKIFNNVMLDQVIPEILRMPLEQLVLRVKSLGIIDTLDFLKKVNFRFFFF